MVSPNHIDDVTRVCGISLGNEEATRIANISLIQAKEEAAIALLKAKQKILLNVEPQKLEVVLEVDNNNEIEKQSSETSLEVESLIVDHNLSQSVPK